jgi:hypothetical protein
VKELGKMRLFDVSLDEPLDGAASDPRARQFSVSNPVKVGGHIKYTVSGVDMEG